MAFTAELTYRALGPLFYQTVAPTPVSAPDWLLFNEALATELQWPEDARQTQLGLHYFSGNQLAPWMQPTALAYTGHQFGSLAPRLGDGRALLLTEVLSQNGQRFDIRSSAMDGGILKSPDTDMRSRNTGEYSAGHPRIPVNHLAGGNSS